MRVIIRIKVTIVVAVHNIDSRGRIFIDYYHRAYK